jgi:hypothetical protein
MGKPRECQYGSDTPSHLRNFGNLILFSLRRNVGAALITWNGDGRVRSRRRSGIGF